MFYSNIAQNSDFTVTKYFINATTKVLSLNPSWVQGMDLQGNNNKIIDDHLLIFRRHF